MGVLSTLDIVYPNTGEKKLAQIGSNWHLISCSDSSESVENSLYDYLKSLKGDITTSLQTGIKKPEGGSSYEVLTWNGVKGEAVWALPKNIMVGSGHTLETQNYSNKSVTAEKLADNISINHFTGKISLNEQFPGIDNIASFFQASNNGVLAKLGPFYSVTETKIAPKGTSDYDGFAFSSTVSDLNESATKIFDRDDKDIVYIGKQGIKCGKFKINRDGTIENTDGSILTVRDSIYAEGAFYALNDLNASKQVVDGNTYYNFRVSTASGSVYTTKIFITQNGSRLDTSGNMTNYSDKMMSLGTDSYGVYSLHGRGNRLNIKGAPIMLSITPNPDTNETIKDQNKFISLWSNLSNSVFDFSQENFVNKRGIIVAAGLGNSGMFPAGIGLGYFDNRAIKLSSGRQYNISYGIRALPENLRDDGESLTFFQSVKTDKSAYASAYNFGVTANGRVISHGLIVYPKVEANDYFRNEGSEITPLMDITKTDIIVNGNIKPRTNGNVTLGTSANAWKGVYAQTISQTSDRKKKKHIECLNTNNIYNFIMGLQPVSYEFKADKNEDKHFGFIAQEVDEIARKTIGASNIVIAYDEHYQRIDTNKDYDEEKSNWFLSYDNFIAPAILMIQEQQKEIQQLKADVSTLKAEVRKCQIY